MCTDERAAKLVKLMEDKLAGEQAYDDMYDAHSSSDAAAFCGEAKEYFYTAIALARELGFSHILRSSCLQLIEPLAEAVLISLYPCQHRTSSVNEKPAQIWIASLANTQQSGLSAS